MRLCDFRNEPYTDFSVSENAGRMRAALSAVRAEFGREYDIRIGEARYRTGALLASLNPSRPSETVGAHHKATPELAREAIEAADAFFPQWAAVAVSERAAMLRREKKPARGRGRREPNRWSTGSISKISSRA